MPIGIFPFDTTVTLGKATSPVDTAISGYTLTNADAQIIVSDSDVNTIKLIYNANPVIPDPVAPVVPPLVIPDYPAQPDNTDNDPEVPTIDVEDPEVPTTDVEPDDEIIDIEDPEIPDTAANASVAFAVLTAITSAAAIFMNKSKSKK